MNMTVRFTTHPRNMNFSERTSLASNLAFQHLTPFWNVETNRWPTLEELGQGSVVKFVNPQESKGGFSDHYEVRIAERNEVETRMECWHDFCNALIWRGYPKSKQALNKRYYQALCQRKETWSRSSRRSTEEDLCTVINENAVLIAYEDETDKELIQSFLWHDFFWKRRLGLKDRMELFFWGHALLEKSRHPYIGMTGHAIFIRVRKEFFTSAITCKVDHIDSSLHSILEGKRISSVQDLSPFPILGFPGFYADAEQESFYENRWYFRTGRKGKKLR